MLPKLDEMKNMQLRSKRKRARARASFFPATTYIPHRNLPLSPHRRHYLLTHQPTMISPRPFSLLSLLFAILCVLSLSIRAFLSPPSLLSPLHPPRLSPTNTGPGVPCCASAASSCRLVEVGKGSALTRKKQLREHRTAC